MISIEKKKNRKSRLGAKFESLKRIDLVRYLCEKMIVAREGHKKYVVDYIYIYIYRRIRIIRQ